MPQTNSPGDVQHLTSFVKRQQLYNFQNMVSHSKGLLLKVSVLLNILGFPSL